MLWTHLSPLRAKLLALRNDYRLVQGEAMGESLRRAKWLGMLTVPLHLGVALAAWLGLFKTTATVAAHAQPWAQGLIGRNLLTGSVVGILLLAIAWLRRRQNEYPTIVTILHGLSCTSYLLFGVVAAVADIRSGAGVGVATFTLVCLLLASQLLLHPLTSAILYMGAVTTFCALLDVAKLPPSVFVNPLLAFFASITSWHQYTRTVLLRRELAEKNTKLEYFANHDTLTGLFNRREFTRLALLELSRSARYGTEASIIIMDIDYFKKINDQHGHPVGDAVLQRVAQLLTEGVRASDVLGRLGGEEFIVLMPQAGCTGALALAEKLRQQLEQDVGAMQGGACSVTASFGVSSVPSSRAVSFEDLYHSADAALYRAKETGRNRVESAPCQPLSGASAGRSSAGEHFAQKINT